MQALHLMRRLTELSYIELWDIVGFPFRHLSLSVNIVMKFNNAEPQRGHSQSFFYVRISK